MAKEKSKVKASEKAVAKASKAPVAKEAKSTPVAKAPAKEKAVAKASKAPVAKEAKPAVKAKAAPVVDKAQAKITDTLTASKVTIEKVKTTDGVTVVSVSGALTAKQFGKVKAIAGRKATLATKGENWVLTYQ